jgi:hypothetical protein
VTLEVPQDILTSRRNERLLDESESNCSFVEYFVLYILHQQVLFLFISYDHFWDGDERVVKGTWGRSRSV